MESAARIFVLTAANMTGEEMASAFVAALPRIAKVCAAASGPMMKVHRNGTLGDLWPDRRSATPRRPRAGFA